MIILGVECTAGPVSCAILDDGKLKAEFFLNVKTTHSQTLMPMIESAIGACGLKMSDIDLIAVTEGPGSFTGVRIGVSAVKGLAQPLDTKCMPVSVLLGMAYNMVAEDCYVCAVMDARCNQVYNALFSVENGEVKRLCDDRALMMDELKPEIDELTKANDKPIFIVGDGAELFYSFLNGELDGVKLAPPQYVMQRASGICLAAKYNNDLKPTVSAKDLLPKYLRLPQAERELKAKQSKG